MCETYNVSVVVPFFNAEETLLLCLKGLASQVLQPFEVILVDNNSTDGSANIVKDFIATHSHNFKYLFEERQGPSYARNCGGRQARGDILAFTDSDCIPDSNWLHDVVRAFKDPKIGAVAGGIENFGTESIFEKFHAMFTLRSLPETEAFTEFTLIKGGFPTANLAVRKDVFDSIGGFDESMKFFGEDYDLCARIYQAGFAIKNVAGGIVYHKHRKTFKGTWKQSFGFGTAHTALLKKHFKRMVLIEIPKYRYISRKWPICMWLDFASADKKIVTLLPLLFVWWPFVFFLVFYLVFLYRDMTCRLHENNMKAGFVEKWQLVFFLFFKSTAFTAGRVVGSFRNKVLCF